MTVIETIGVREEIATFAASVRLHLDDLPADEVDDLVDGLEADLGEQALDQGEAFETPDAAGYAAELRAAAGLPPRASRGSKPSVRARVGRELTRRYRDLRARPGVAATIDFLASLRPAWWLLRGFIVFEAVNVGMRGTWLSLDLFGVLLLAGCLIVSVQWGRGRWAPTRWLRVTRLAVSIAAVIALPALLFGAFSTYSQWQSGNSMSVVAYAGQPGLTSDGQRVRNIFAYDADGQPLSDVQLFDQDGQPLATVGRDGLQYDWQEDEYFFGGGGPVPVAETGPGLQPVWNVYPLRELPAGAGPWNAVPQEAVAPVPPFLRAPAIGEGWSSSPTPQPTATSFGDPSPSPSATPAVAGP